MAKMFNGKEDNVITTNSAAPQTVIGHGIKVEGTFSGSGDVIIRGEVDGTMTTAGDLMVEEGAVVSANIEAQNVRISGQVSGNITCHGQLDLASTAQVLGDVVTDVISVDNGAIMQGQCQTGARPTKTAPVETVEDDTEDVE